MRRFTRQFHSCFDELRDPLLIVDAEGTILESNLSARSTLDLGEHVRIDEASWADRRIAFDGRAVLALLKGPSPVVGHRLNDLEGNEADVVLDIIDLPGRESDSHHKLIHIKDYSPYTNTERWKDELLSMVAHEIKNPLAAMKNSMSILVAHAAGAMTEGQRSLLDVSLRSIDRLTRLLDNVLDVSRIGSGGYTPEPRWMYARDFTAEVVGTFRTLFNVQRRRLACAVAGDLGPVYVDAPKLEQVLVNLLSNALKFTPEGGEITVEVEPAGIEVLDDDLRILPWSELAEMRFVRFIVTDTGIGMSESMLSHLFTRYYAEESRTRSKGSHLGLSISKALVEVQNGSLAIESELGVGTRVRVALPADDVTFAVLGRVKSIGRVLGRLHGLRRGVVCRVYRKDPSLAWDRVIEHEGVRAIVNPTVGEEKSGDDFLWTLSDRVAVSITAGETDGRQSGAGRPAEGDSRTATAEPHRRSNSPAGYTVGVRTLLPNDTRAARVLALALRNKDTEEKSETTTTTGTGGHERREAAPSSSRQ